MKYTRKNDSEDKSYQQTDLSTKRH